MVKKIISICAAGMIVASCSPKKTTAQPTDPSTTDSELTMLVGTYTSGNSKGIYTFRFNEETGESLPLSDAEVANPSYLIPSATESLSTPSMNLAKTRPQSAPLPSTKKKELYTY